MSLKPRLPPRKRKEIIKKNIAFKVIGGKQDAGTIAWECGVDRKTIQRDIKKMQKTGEWDEFIEETVLKLSQIGDIDDVTKWREWMKIYGKRFTEKHEVKTRGTQTINVVFDKDMKDELGDKLSASQGSETIP